MFIAVMSTRASLDNTIAAQVQEYGYDVIVWLERPLRATQLIAATQNVEGVERVEVWSAEGGTMESNNGQEFYVRLWGLPPDSTMFKPRMVQGRWLNPEDEFTIVINSKAAMDRRIQIGDTLTWKFDPKERKWTVIGIIVDSSDGQANCFVPIHALATMEQYAGQGTIVAVQATQHDRVSQNALVERLREAFATAHLKANTIDSVEQKGAQIRSQFDIVVYLLLTMTLLAAIVGSIGLMGTISINVVERTREIGVMRAIGATSFAVIRLFIGEGIVMGVLSWLIALPLSYPAAQVLGNMVGNLLLRAPLDFVYAMEGAAGWLLIVVGLSALGSLLPALRAAQMSVRETLAYE
jgi:putative ABC transport system permease protein